MKRVSYQLIDITKPYSKLFKKAIRIYKETFPSYERETVKEIIKKIKMKNEGVYSPNKFYFVGFLRNGEVIGFAEFFYLFKTNSGFLSYIGITPPLQDRGFGTKLYKMIRDILNRDAIEARREPLRSFIYELESPVEKCSLEEKIQRKRRFRFYRRLGAKRIKNISYALPKLRESNNKKTTHLILMVYSTISISKDFLKNLVDDYLRIAYGFKKGLVRGNNEKTFRRVKKQIFQAIEERYTPN